MTMTDYIIIVALVAIACLALAGALGYRLSDTNRQALGALNGQSLEAAKIEASVSEAHMGKFAANTGGVPGESGMTGTGAAAGNEDAIGVDSGENETWEKFKDKFAKNIVKAAKENYKINVNEVMKETARDLKMSEEIYAQMVKRVPEVFAVHGEQGAINALEALTDVTTTMSRAQYADKAVKVFNIVEKTAKVGSVVGSIPDILDFTSELEKSVTDPAHQSEHEGTAVGQVAGVVGSAAAGAALITLTAPVTAPVLVVGLLGAAAGALIGIVLKPAGGWVGGKLGSWFDSQRAERTVIRED